MEWYGVTRVSEGLELGARVTLSPSSLDLAKFLGRQPPTPDLLQDYRQSTEVSTAPLSKSLFMFRLEGRFSGL
jgi:hypothetical protein